MVVVVILWKLFQWWSTHCLYSYYTLRRPAESRESLEPVQADTWLAAPLVALSPLSAGESVSVGV